MREEGLSYVYGPLDEEKGYSTVGLDFAGKRLSFAFLN